MSCTVSEMPSGCRLRGMSSTAQNVGPGTSNTGNHPVTGNGGSSGNGGTAGVGGINSSLSSINTGGIHVGGMLNTTSALSTTSSNNPRESSSSALQRQRQQSQKPCCFCWCWCCTCSCLQLKGADDAALTKRDQGSADLLLDGEQPTLDEIRSWGKSFDKLMKSNNGRKIFRDFLRSEFSEENILFWLACEELKKESSADVIEEKARLIYEDYISILSPREVSLDSRVREIVNKNMVEPTPNTFDEAQIQIYTLMHRDSYPRFLNSQKFKTLAQLTDGMSTAGSISESPT